VQADVTFAGVLVVRRGLRVAAGARLELRGALWIAQDGAPALAVDGLVQLRHDAAALAAADALLALPRRARLAGLRDLG
jgi:hypothetical protein